MASNESNEQLVNIEDCLDESLVYINSENKYINISNEIPIITTEADSTIASIEIIKSTIDKLYEQIDFLKEEILEKNLLIKILNFRNANNGNKINIEMINESTFLSLQETISTSTMGSSLTEISNTSHYNSQSDTSGNNLPSVSIINVVKLVDYYETLDNVHINLSSNNTFINSMHTANVDNTIVLNNFSESLDLNKSITVMNSTKTYESFDDQLHSYRVQNHNKFTYEKQHSSNNKICNKSINMYAMSNELSNENDVMNNIEDITSKNNIAATTIHEWQHNTILVTGDSILNGLEENRLNKLKVKVRAFPGASTEDMYDYLAPLLRKKPTHIILHIGSNDSPDKTSNVIMKDILKLRTHIESVLPQTLRLDHAKAGLTLYKLIRKMKSLGNVILNDNIDGSCLGKSGLHLNPKGSGRLAMNYLSLMWRL